MTTIRISLKEIHQLAKSVLIKAGADDANASAVADNITAAQQNGSESHGLFRLPGYVASLRSGKVSGDAVPTLKKIAPAVIQVDNHNGYAPLAQKVGLPALRDLTKNTGIAALSITRSYHFAALWPEVSYLAEAGLCALAVTSHSPMVAPFGGNEPFFSTNPMAFAWPRAHKSPVVFDQASAAMARGDIMIYERDGKTLPDGTAIDAHGQPTNDASEALKGAQLPFGGYKGSNIAMMIEFLVGPLIGEACAYEAGEVDNKDGGPVRGGELILAFDPAHFGSKRNVDEHAEQFISRLLAQEGTRLPGDSRYKVSQKNLQDGVEIPKSLYDKIIELNAD